MDIFIWIVIMSLIFRIQNEDDLYMTLSVWDSVNGLFSLTLLTPRMGSLSSVSAEVGHPAVHCSSASAAVHSSINPNNNVSYMNMILTYNGSW